jgi:hypothetical protein
VIVFSQKLFYNISAWMLLQRAPMGTNLDEISAEVHGGIGSVQTSMAAAFKFSFV